MLLLDLSILSQAFLTLKAPEILDKEDGGDKNLLHLIEHVQSWVSHHINANTFAAPMLTHPTAKC